MCHTEGLPQDNVLSGAVDSGSVGGACGRHVSHGGSTTAYVPPGCSQTCGRGMWEACFRQREYCRITCCTGVSVGGTCGQAWVTTGTCCEYELLQYFGSSKFSELGR